jgi:hypothetical protein
VVHRTAARAQATRLPELSTPANKPNGEPRKLLGVSDATEPGVSHGVPAAPAASCPAGSTHRWDGACSVADPHGVHGVDGVDGLERLSASSILMDD